MAEHGDSYQHGAGWGRMTAVGDTDFQASLSYASRPCLQTLERDTKKYEKEREGITRLCDRAATINTYDLIAGGSLAAGRTGSEMYFRKSLWDFSPGYQFG